MNEKSQSEKAAEWDARTHPEGVDGIIHVYPSDEANAHILFGTGCPCGPRTNRYGVVVHSAFDGREWAERAAEIFDHPERVLAN